jgi:hypothetical protein
MCRHPTYDPHRGYARIDESADIWHLQLPRRGTQPNISIGMAICVGTVRKGSSPIPANAAYGLSPAAQFKTTMMGVGA